MPTLELTDEQVVRLIEQLPPEKQQSVYKHLARRQWANWLEASQGAEDKVRRLAKERGLDWDALDDSQRLAFVDDLVHDDNGRRS